MLTTFTMTYVQINKLTVNIKLDLWNYGRLNFEVNSTFVESLIIDGDTVNDKSAWIVGCLIECSAFKDSVIRPVSCLS